MQPSPSHLSASSLKTFLACPRKYRLRYLDRAQPAWRSVALAVGSAFHNAAGHWLVRLALGKSTCRDEIHAVFDRALRRELHDGDLPILYDDDETDDDLHAKGHEMLDAFVQRVPVPDEVLGVELPFELEIVDPETGEVFPPVVGAIDALIRHRGRKQSWELKTAKKRWAEDALIFDIQSTIYDVAIRSEHPDAQPVLIAVTKALRPDVQVERLRKGPSDEDDLIATVRGVTRAVEAGVDHPVRSWACKRCEYTAVCR